MRLAILLVDDFGTAEDVVQDAFAAFAARKTSLRDRNAALGYLRISVVNGARSTLRRRRTARAYAPPHEVEPDGPDARAVLSEEHRQVLDGLKQLAPRQREVLVLRYWSGISEREIAEALDISRGSVKSTASRALDALREAAAEPRGGHAMSTEHRGPPGRCPGRPRGDRAAARPPRRAAARPSRRPVHQRPSTWLLAAAACLAVVAVPLAVMAGQGDDGSLPCADHPAPRLLELPDTPQGPGADWPQVGKDDRRFDVDGDGVQDVVRLRNSTGKGSADVPWRVEVELAAGGVAGVVLDDVGYGVSLAGPTDVDGNGDDEILYSAGVDGDWGVLELTPDGLVDLRVKEPGLSNVPDAEGHLRSTWSEDGLFTTVSLEAGYFPGDDSARIPSTYPVTFVRWHLVGDTLSPEAQGGQCVSNMNPDLPFACDQDSVVALPSFLPEVTDSAPVGKTVTTSFEQSLVELELVGDRGDVAADGDVELRVTVDGQPYAAPVPAGGEPRVYATLLGGARSPWSCGRARTTRRTPSSGCRAVTSSPSGPRGTRLPRSMARHGSPAGRSCSRGNRWGTTPTGCGRGRRRPTVSWPSRATTRARTGCASTSGPTP